MSAIVSTRQVGDGLEQISGIPPQSANTAATIHGTGYDRLGGDTGAPYESCDLVLQTGTSTGGPGTQTVTAVIEHCTTLGGTYTAYTDPTTNLQPSVSVTADNTVKRVKVNLVGANQFIRTTVTTTYTTITAQLIAANIVLGGAATTPTPN